MFETGSSGGEHGFLLDHSAEKDSAMATKKRKHRFWFEVTDAFRIVTNPEQFRDSTDRDLGKEDEILRPSFKKLWVVEIATSSSLDSVQITASDASATTDNFQFTIELPGIYALVESEGKLLLEKPRIATGQPWLSALCSKFHVDPERVFILPHLPDGFGEKNIYIENPDGEIACIYIAESVSRRAVRSRFSNLFCGAPLRERTCDHVTGSVPEVSQWIKRNLAITFEPLASPGDPNPDAFSYTMYIRCIGGEHIGNSSVLTLKPSTEISRDGFFEVKEVSGDPFPGRLVQWRIRKASATEIPAIFGGAFPQLLQELCQVMGEFADEAATWAHGRWWINSLTLADGVRFILIERQPHVSWVDAHKNVGVLIRRALEKNPPLFISSSGNSALEALQAVHGEQFLQALARQIPVEQSLQLLSWETQCQGFFRDDNQLFWLNGPSKDNLSLTPFDSPPLVLDLKTIMNQGVEVGSRRLSAPLASHSFIMGALSSGVGRGVFTLRPEPRHLRQCQQVYVDRNWCRLLVVVIYDHTKQEEQVRVLSVNTERATPPPRRYPGCTIIGSKSLYKPYVLVQAGSLST